MLSTLQFWHTHTYVLQIVSDIASVVKSMFSYDQQSVSDLDMHVHKR